MITAVSLFLIIVGVLLFLLLIRLLRKPIKWILKLLFNALIGFAALLLLNYFGAAIGISLNVNWFNAIVTGILGIPGVVLLLLLKYVL